MTDLLLFAVGFLLFAVTTTATMWFGYQQFNRIYRSDIASEPKARVLVRDANNNEFRVAAEILPTETFEVIEGASNRFTA